MEKKKKTQKTSPSKRKKKKNKKKAPNFFMQFFITILIIVVISVGLGELLNLGDTNDDKAMTLTELATAIEADEVAEITVKGSTLDVILKKTNEVLDPDGNVIESENGEELEIEKTVRKESGSNIIELLGQLGVSQEDLRDTNIIIKDEVGPGLMVLRIFELLIPFIIIGLIIWFFLGQMRGGGGGMKAFSFGNSKAKVIDPNSMKVTFKDVAGNENAKDELKEIVDFLRFPKKYFEMGATIPKGVLLTGVPGTGKTLLARAVAGEAKVPFFHLSGSEFVEMFVGVGASRVRDLFEQAKAAAPAIMFIDEIDAVGRHRGVGIGGGNDEREQTLNQILVEMDGFEPTQKVIVIAATNRSDVLDNALLRPGRFDRRVTLDVPDRKDREAILKIHAKKKPLGQDVDLKVIATRTPGFSGADLESLMNESALWAARHNKKEISQSDIIASIEKVMIGPERKSHTHTEKGRELTAYHEAGHALVASVLEHCDPVHKISIIARGHAGGYTLKLPDEDRKLSFRQTYLDDIAMSLGGYVAEKMIYNDVTTGPSNDLQVATKLANNMVTRWGMSDLVGPVALEGNDGRTMFGGGGVDKDRHSERHEEMIDSEVSRIMAEARVRAEEILTEHRNVLVAVKDALLEKESLEQDEYEAIIAKFGIVVKKKNITS